MIFNLTGIVKTQQLFGENQHRVSIDFDEYKGYLSLPVDKEMMKDLQLGDKVTIQIVLSSEVVGV